jgi:hypothetical protein
MLENLQTVATWSKFEWLRNITAVGLFLVCAAEILSYVIRERTRKTKLVDLPVLNLRGHDYAEAESSYIGNMVEWMKLGREKVRKLHTGPHRHKSYKVAGLVLLLMHRNQFIASQKWLSALDT